MFRLTSWASMREADVKRMACGSCDGQDGVTSSPNSSRDGEDSSSIRYNGNVSVWNGQ